MGQLRMLFDARRQPLPEVGVPAGYRLTRNGPEAAERYAKLREEAGWEPMPPALLTDKILPRGLVLCEDLSTGRPVASATGEKPDWPQEFPHFGELGWVMCLVGLRGKHLGLLASVAAMRIGLEAGFHYLSLTTDDWRLPAIKMYLRLGWLPWLSDPDHRERWQAVCAQLALPFTPIEDAAVRALPRA